MIKTAISDQRVREGRLQGIDLGNGKAGLRLQDMAYGTYETAIFNSSGRSVGRSRISVGAPMQQFNLDDLELLPGLYAIRIYNNGLQLVQKFVMR